MLVASTTPPKIITEALEQFRAEVQRRLTARRHDGRRMLPEAPTRYDDVFWDGWRGSINEPATAPAGAAIS